MLDQFARSVLAAIGALAIAAPGLAQVSKPFEFGYWGQVQPGQAVFVVGDAPELGNGDVRYGVKLVSNDDPQWRISVDMAPGQRFNYWYVLRDVAPSQIGNAANAASIGRQVTAASAESASPMNSKLIFARLRAPSPKLRYRLRRTPAAPFADLPMARFGPGRTTDETTFVGLGAGAPDEAIEFYFADDSTQFRDPSTGTYTTSLRAAYIQDQRIFTYEPVGASSVQFPSDATNRPFEIYDKVGGSEASGYPVLDRTGCQYRSLVLFSSHAFGIYPVAGPHMILLAPDGKEGYMIRHLNRVAEDVAFRIPDPNYSGLVVIDYEAWWPHWTGHPNDPSNLPFDADDGDPIDDWKDYIRAYRPELLAGLNAAQQEEVFKSTWLAIAREYIERTIRKVKELRPNAKVAMYDMPNQEYWGWRIPGWTALRHNVDDTELAWLYDLQDVIVGGGYTFYYALPDSIIPGSYQDNQTLGATLYFNNLIDECQYVCRGKPIYLFIEPVYHSSNPIYGYQPLNDFNMRAMFEIPYQRGINGVIVWGWIRDLADAAMWTTFYHNTFTPYVSTLFQRPRVQAGVTCPTGNLQPSTPGPSPARRDYSPSSPPTINSTVYGGPRAYRVVLPRGYAEHTNRRYPVIFFQDGGDAFDQPTGSSGWDALPGLLAAVESGKAGEAILVGVDPGPQRSMEYTPVASGGWADQYLAFLRDELLPQIESHYRTLPGHQAVGTIGAGQGGQAAFYLGWAQPSIFSRVATLSGSWRSNFLGFYNQVLADPARNLRVYLDSGDSGADADIYNLTTTLRDNLASKSGHPLITDRDLKWVVGFGQSPTPSAWQQRLPNAYSFLYPASEETAPLMALLHSHLDLDTNGMLSIDDFAVQSRLPQDLDADGSVTPADTRLLESVLRAREAGEMCRSQR